jgi:hypothetical protein
MAPLPRIACFHGGGSNSAIFEFQCQRLQQTLKDDFEFVYFDALYERGPGPGVMPFFEDYAPFRTWFKVDGENEISDFAGQDGVERILKLIAKKGTGGEWVAAMGFSQGTRAVGGLLLDQQRRAEAGFDPEIEFKFGVLCMGGGAPMQSKSSRGMSKTVMTIGVSTPMSW